MRSCNRNGTEEIIEAEDMDKYSNEMVEKGASKIYALAAARDALPQAHMESQLQGH